MSPSLLSSIAGETIAFAKPVIGTSVPAPANFAKSSKTPSPVARAARKTSVTGTSDFTVSSGSDVIPYSILSTSAKAQIAPPQTNAAKTSLKSGDFFAFFAQYFLYSFSLISKTVSFRKNKF